MDAAWRVGVGDACKLNCAGQVGLRRASFQPPRTPGFPCPGDRQARSFPTPVSQPTFSGDSIPGQESPGSFLRVRTHFSQLLPFPGAPAFQDAALSVGFEVVSVTVFTDHSASPASFPILASNSHFLNTWCPGLCHTLSHREQERKALCPFEAYVSVEKTDKTQVHEYTNTRPVRKETKESLLFLDDQERPLRDHPNLTTRGSDF